MPPRPLILVGATGDWTKLTMNARLPGDPRRVFPGRVDRSRQHQVFDFPHNYNQTTRNAVYAAMGRRLLGIDDPESTREGKQQPEKPEDSVHVRRRSSGAGRPEDPDQLEAFLIETRRLVDDIGP